jgi:hypothetical protein
LARSTRARAVRLAEQLVLPARYRLAAALDGEGRLGLAELALALLHGELVVPRVDPDQHRPGRHAPARHEVLGALDDDAGDLRPERDLPGRLHATHGLDDGRPRLDVHGRDLDQPRLGHGPLARRLGARLEQEEREQPARREHRERGQAAGVPGDRGRTLAAHASPPPMDASAGRSSVQPPARAR